MPEREILTFSPQRGKAGRKARKLLGASGRKARKLFWSSRTKSPAVFCTVFCATACTELKKAKKEITLDRHTLCFTPAKGYFCELLISNIIGYLTFLNWTQPSILHHFRLFRWRLIRSRASRNSYEDSSCLSLIQGTIFSCHIYLLTYSYPCL